MQQVSIVGTGSFIPPHVHNNEHMARVVGEKDAAWVTDLLGIETRHFMTPISSQTGQPELEVDELDMAVVAAKQAMASAGIKPEDVGYLWYITCTQPDGRRHFSRMAMELHERLGLRPEALPFEMDAGCGGSLHALDVAKRLLAGSDNKVALVVSSNCPSQFMDREDYRKTGAWLSMFIFGDGAGAMVLRKSEEGQGGIIASYLAVDSSSPLMRFESRIPGVDPVYEIDAKQVAKAFGRYAWQAIEALMNAHPFSLADIKRFYFHQVNPKVLRRFLNQRNIPLERTPIHADRYGNTAAAATFILLDEDRKKGLVKEGDLVLFCTIGAGAQYGAMLVRL